MEIEFKSKRLEKECNQRSLCVKAHGLDRATRLSRRLDSLRAATCLDDLRNAPGRLHELTMNRKGQLSIDLDHPYRLIFTPNHNPIPTRPEGGMDWSQISSVIILGIEDTHD